MRVMIDICYDGSKFEGFASQPHGRTVADTLAIVLEKIYKQPVSIFGSSRTDSKVSAKTQYIVFDPPFTIEPDNIVRAINAIIDKAIYCKSAQLVPDRYMPRHDVEYKTYKYTITREYRPMYRHLEYFIRHQLNVEAMQTAANYLVGTHDFSSFCSANTDVTDKVRTIFDLSVEQDDNQVVLTISGDGFLYNMVRIIAGTLIVFGLEKENPDLMQEILASKDRAAAYSTAPAHGLMLEYIKLKGSHE
ncbi:tRNA pseudouridine(38-40) synthase TruA [Mollicutes bacterium LVI A0039]|nr:tRNA pseudouridine(38-40) synthase TruA [Mollicutes bacterium LVI A0039]